MHSDATSRTFLALHSVKLLVLSRSSEFLLSQPSAGADLFVLEGALLFEHQMPQNV